jgi:hypothetical protein
MAAKPLRAVPSQPTLIDVPVVGRICGYDPERGLLVDFPQNQAAGPIPARWTMLLDEATAQKAVAEQQKAVLVFEDGDPAQPLVTGLVQPLQLKATDSATTVKLPSQPTDVRLDGKRLTFEAADEIVLRCGQASLTLHRNGKIQLKGAYVLSHSTGTNRIRGGSVQIN